MTFADEIRQAVKDAKTTRGISQYKISQETHISQTQLSYFVHGGWFTEEPLNELAEYLGLEVRRPPP